MYGRPSCPPTLLHDVALSFTAQTAPRFLPFVPKCHRACFTGTSGLFYCPPTMLLGITGVISGTTISKEAPTLDTTGPASTDTMSAHYTPSAAPTRSADRACALGQPLHAVAQQGALHAALPGSVVSILGERRQLDPLPPHIWSAAAQTLNSTVSWRLDWLDSATTLHESTGRWRDVAAARRSGGLPVVLLGTSPTSGCGAREDVTNTSRRTSAADFTEVERACDSSFGWARLFYDYLRALMTDGQLGLASHASRGGHHRDGHASGYGARDGAGRAEGEARPAAGGSSSDRASPVEVAVWFKNAVEASYFGHCAGRRVPPRTRLIILEVCGTPAAPWERVLPLARILLANVRHDVAAPVPAALP